MITIFTPSYADEADTNAQNLSVKEIVARLDPEHCAVTMLHEGAPDPRISARPNTRLLRWGKHGNTLRTILHLAVRPPDVYFFPREGPLDAAFLTLRRRFGLRTAVVSYVVSGGLMTAPYSTARERHIREADAVFDNNTYLGELLKEKMEVVSSGTMYDGIDRRYFHPPSARRLDDTVTVLCAGSFRPYKRMPMVVRQAARWPAMRFRIAGVGEELDACRRLAAELGCTNIEFLGHLSQPQLGRKCDGLTFSFSRVFSKAIPRFCCRRQVAGSQSWRWKRTGPIVWYMGLLDFWPAAMPSFQKNWRS